QATAGQASRGTRVLHIDATLKVREGEARPLGGLRGNRAAYCRCETAPAGGRPAVGREVPATGRPAVGCRPTDGGYPRRELPETFRTPSDDKRPPRVADVLVVSGLPPDVRVARGTDIPATRR